MSDVIPDHDKQKVNELLAQLDQNPDTRDDAQRELTAFRMTAYNLNRSSLAADRKAEAVTAAHMLFMGKLLSLTARTAPPAPAPAPAPVPEVPASAELVATPPTSAALVATDDDDEPAEPTPLAPRERFRTGQLRDQLTHEVVSTALIRIVQAWEACGVVGWAGTKTGDPAALTGAIKHAAELCREMFPTCF